MIVYRDLNIDEWWVYENEQWWHGCGWKLAYINQEVVKCFQWSIDSVGPSLHLIDEGELMQSTPELFHNAKCYPIELK